MTSRPLIFRLAQWGSRNSFETLYRMESAGLEHIPLEGPLLIAGNHASFMDPPAIGCIFPEPAGFLPAKLCFEARFPTIFCVISSPFQSTGMAIQMWEP